MESLIKNIYSANYEKVSRLANEIRFEVDYEGKSFLNQQTQILYKRKLSPKQVVDIVLKSIIVIDKMTKLEKSGWSEKELYQQLYNSLKYYSNKYDISRERLENMLKDYSTQYLNDINDKYPATFRAIDGHYVRSKSELLIDNLLFANGIVHAYEKRLPIQEYYLCDFYIPPNKERAQSIYIEHWGFNGESYVARKNEKIRIYKALDLVLVETYEDDIYTLQEKLAEKLGVFGILIE